MPEKEKFTEIFDKVRKTFDILREMLPETPLEPTEGSVGQLPVGQAKQINRAMPGGTGLGKDSTATNSLSNHKSPSLYKARQEYVENILASYEFVRLPGFSAGNESLKIPLEKAFVPYTLFDKRLGSIRPERDDGFYGSAGALSIASALHRYRRLAIIGSPGSGKTCLLVTTLLAYARSMRNEQSGSGSSQPNRETSGNLFSKQRITPSEENYLPIFVSLRDLGQHLQERHHRSDKDGPTRLMSFLRAAFPSTNNSILSAQENFFELHLAAGKAIVLLDGLDEVEKPELRRRVIQLIEKFVQKYSSCRYIITSRPLGCEGVPILGEQFGTLEIREFSPVEARQFIRSWSLTLEKGIAGNETPEVLQLANQRADEFIRAMAGNVRTAELAVTPLNIILLALAQRFQDRWPDRRADLYETVLNISLDHKDSMHVTAPPSLTRAEKKRTLIMIAFWLHEQNKLEIHISELKTLLQPWFLQMRNGDATSVPEVIEYFIQSTIIENNGAFVEIQPGRYRFAHRSLQEFLSAQALADREDTLAFTRPRLSLPWWREVILFEAGILGKKTQYRVSELVQFILDADPEGELQPCYTTFLAANCLADLDPRHLEVSLLVEVKNSLKKIASAHIQDGDRQSVVNKVTASNALMSLQAGQPVTRFWKLQYGEPEWVRIPAGEFWMGEADDLKQPGSLAAHRVFLPEYHISRVAITNAQYAMYLKDSGSTSPDHWHNGQPPRGKENHPVVNINWHEALAYCIWLEGKIKHPVCLPSEAEWEKAARGTQDLRLYPWGDWEELHSNTSELSLGDTTPVGLFPYGASPFGLLDMTGNVREWTRSLSSFSYPYDPTDKAREDINAPDDQPRVLRGGSYYCTRESARCTQRQRYYPDFGFYNFGFRVVILPMP